MKRLIVLLLALLFVCPAFAEEAPLSGEIVAADKHGNVATDLPSADLLARYALGDLLAVTINEERIIAPLVVRYSDVNVGEPLVYANGDGQVAFAVNYKSFQDTYAAQPGTSFEIELVEVGAYLDQFEIRNLVRSEARDDYATDEVFANFRPVIEGVLYRGASPILPDDARSPYVMALVKEAGIKTVVNLAQTSEELAEIPDAYGEMSAVAVGIGTDVHADSFAPGLKAALTFIAGNETPCFIHCNEGKDRAGIVCALIEGLMGFTPEQIVEDYMTSYVNYYGVEKDTEKYALLAQQIKSLMEDLLGAPMNADTLPGAVEKYLTDVVGFQPDALRARLGG